MLFSRIFAHVKVIVMAGIYIHIPFCKNRCIYCDFYSTTRHEMQQVYAETLCKELEMRRNYLNGDEIETIYFGGGTPSQLNENQLSKILSHIYKVYQVKNDAEITIECNPDDLKPEYITMLRRLSFNRISMGIQTFNENTLKVLHRRHSAAEAVNAYQACRKAGFQNISIDLMYGLPNETIKQWHSDLQQAIALKPEHISAYHLIYEKGTPLYKLLKQHKIQEVDENLSLKFFTMLMDELELAGYIHYEISNFCLPNYHSRHNSSYWTGKKYIGCGPSAHSFDGISRQWNISSLEAYLNSIREGKLNFEKEEENLYTRYNDFVITSVRTCWGMSLSILKERFGDKLFNYCLEMASPHVKQKLMTIQNNMLRLTREGIFISDGIMSDLLWVEE